MDVDDSDYKMYRRLCCHHYSARCRRQFESSWASFSPSSSPVVFPPMTNIDDDDDSIINATSNVLSLSNNYKNNSLQRSLLNHFFTEELTNDNSSSVLTSEDMIPLVTKLISRTSYVAPTDDKNVGRNISSLINEIRRHNISSKSVNSFDTKIVDAYNCIVKLANSSSSISEETIVWLSSSVIQYKHDLETNNSNLKMTEWNVITKLLQSVFNLVVKHSISSKKLCDDGIILYKLLTARENTLLKHQLKLDKSFLTLVARVKSEDELKTELKLLQARVGDVDTMQNLASHAILNCDRSKLMIDIIKDFDIVVLSKDVIRSLVSSSSTCTYEITNIVLPFILQKLESVDSFKLLLELLYDRIIIRHHNDDDLAAKKQLYEKCSIIHSHLKGDDDTSKLSVKRLRALCSLGLLSNVCNELQNKNPIAKQIIKNDLFTNFDSFLRQRGEDEDEDDLTVLQQCFDLMRLYDVPLSAKVLQNIINGYSLYFSSLEKTRNGTKLFYNTVLPLAAFNISRDSIKFDLASIFDLNFINLSITPRVSRSSTMDYKVLNATSGFIRTIGRPDLLCKWIYEFKVGVLGLPVDAMDVQVLVKAFCNNHLQLNEALSVVQRAHNNDYQTCVLTSDALETIVKTMIISRENHTDALDYIVEYKNLYPTLRVNDSTWEYLMQYLKDVKNDSFELDRLAHVKASFF